LCRQGFTPKLIDYVDILLQIIMSTTAPTLDTSSQPVDANVDKTSISPTRTDKEGLEKKLSLRPDVQDLKNRNILLNTSAAP